MFNRKTKNGQWQKDEWITFAGRFTRRDPRIEVEDLGNGYQIKIDGATVHLYNKRFPTPVTGLFYLVEPDNIPLFGDTLAVEVHPNSNSLGFF